MTSRLGAVVVLLGLLFAAYEGTEWMRQGVMEWAAPPTLDLPPAVCPPDELEEEGISVAECEQLVADVRSYLASRPDWFFGVQFTLFGLGTLLALASILAGTWLLRVLPGGARLGLLVFSALTVVDVGHFIAAQLAGPILRGIHLPPTMLWSFVHLALALACYVALGREAADVAARDAAAGTTAAGTTVAGAAAAGSLRPSYGRFEVASHWFMAVSVFFLFVSSWWMLALPLPSAVFRFREFPFQLHKNLGITILLLVVAMAAIRVLRHQAQSAVPAETAPMRKLRIGGHLALYALIGAVCVTGYMSSSYSGWGTVLWWLVELPYWGHENEELNQLYSDLHLYACWGLLLVLGAHIGAALLHAFRDDGIVRRIVRW